MRQHAGELGLGFGARHETGANVEKSTRQSDAAYLIVRDDSGNDWPGEAGMSGYALCEARDVIRHRSIRQQLFMALHLSCQGLTQGDLFFASLRESRHGRLDHDVSQHEDNGNSKGSGSSDTPAHEEYLLNQYKAQVAGRRLRCFTAGFSLLPA